MNLVQVSRRKVLAGVAVLGATADLARAKGSSPIVATECGGVRGFLTENGLAAFRGIPYGASTAGANRFLPPKPAVPWTGVREAVDFGPTAPQDPPDASDHLSVAIPQSEDCLVLNVWTAAPRRGAKKPVMVWLHGGGFSTGSASLPLYDGAHLAAIGDVVVVSVNHRLNAFGYTYLAGVGGADFNDSGNVGQLDIVQALHWVGRNIEAFGGDPSRVTIFGESGGGQKVVTLLAMPPADGLFHRAIAESGPGIRMARVEDQDRAARDLMSLLGLNDVRALQAVPQADLHRAYVAIAHKYPSRGPGFITVFAPTVDGRALPHDPFDPKAPEGSARAPLMIGYNHTEATFFNKGREKLDITDAEIAPRLKGLVGDQGEALVAAYRAALPHVSPWDLLILISTDYPTAAFSRAIAQRKTEAGGAPGYLYRFDWETPVDHMRAPHTIELPFVFSNLDKSFVPLGHGLERPALAHRMSTLWADFARTGVPAAAGVPHWPPYDGRTRETMLLNAKSRLVSDPDKPLRVAVDGALGFAT